MKRINFVLFYLLSAYLTVAQQNHFIYIQTENQQPFYVKVGDRLLSSSTAGYLVIPKLQNGTYEMGIGFPKNEWPLQKITVKVRDNDAGYVLKNFDPNGWGLFNMQTLDIIMATSTSGTDSQSKTGQGDGFADVLADVVSTPSIKQKPVTKEEKKEEKKEVEAENKKVVEPEKKEIADVKPVAPAVKAAVKIYSSLDADGRSMVFTDYNGDKIDTIRIFIPYTAAVEKETVSKSQQLVEPVEKEKKPEPKKEEKKEVKEDKKFLDIDMTPQKAKSDPVELDKPVTPKKEADKPEPVIDEKKNADSKTETAVVMLNSDCKTTASNDDFLKLRKKMAAESSDDEMIAVAKKAFKSKCYSTEQVGNLGVLFLKDDGRYNFFDAAYPRVSDSQNFSRLAEKLTDEYYVTRFKAMIRH